MNNISIPEMYFSPFVFFISFIEFLWHFWFFCKVDFKKIKNRGFGFDLQRFGWKCLGGFSTMGWNWGFNLPPGSRVLGIFVPLWLRFVFWNAGINYQRGIQGDLRPGFSAQWKLKFNPPVCRLVDLSSPSDLSVISNVAASFSRYFYLPPGRLKSSLSPSARGTNVLIDITAKYEPRWTQMLIFQPQRGISNNIVQPGTWTPEHGTCNFYEATSPHQTVAGTFAAGGEVRQWTGWWRRENTVFHRLPMLVGMKLRDFSLLFFNQYNS